MTTGEETGSNGRSFGFGEGLWWSGLAAIASFSVVVLIGGVILGVGFGQSSGDGDAADAAAEQADLLEIGAETFAGTCASCHGAQGEGGVGPAFAGIEDRYPDAADQVQVVIGGRGQMPAFGSTLTDTQIEAVVAYEREVLDAG
jgi:mono/diheme cytochrome c family protein